MTSPLVSVIVPTFNRPKLLARALESIRNQTWSPFQILVINDAGEDVGNIVGPWLSGPDDAYLNHPGNRGLAAARNTGLQHAKGDYIAYLDDDDRYLPHHLETLVRALESGSAKVAYADSERVVYRTRAEGGMEEENRIRVSESFDRNRMLLANYLPVQSFVHARECLEATGPFDEALFRYEDWDLWIRMMDHFDFLHVPGVTSEYRWVDDGTTMSSGEPSAFLEARQRIYTKHGARLTEPIDSLRTRVREQAERIRYLEGYLDKFRSHRLYRLYARLKGLPQDLPPSS